MMILAFVDVHGNMSAVKRIIKKAENVDLIICAGDITNWGVDLEKMFMELKNADKQVLMIHGNHEFEEDAERLCKKSGFIFLHKRIHKIDDCLFFGYGGMGFSLIDKDFEKTANKYKKDLNGKKFVLVTHAPPYKTKIDFLSFAGHRGNKSIRDFIVETKPILAISGHFHETDSKVDKIGKTRIINPGKEGKIIKI